MHSSSVSPFTDPIPYQASIRAAQVELVVSSRGRFRAELTRIDLPIPYETGRFAVIYRIMRPSATRRRSQDSWSAFAGFA
jgi:hypothetical protein